MKHATALLSFLLVLCFHAASEVRATCGDRWDANGAETYTGSACGFNGCSGTFTKTQHWNVRWVDSNTPRAVDVTGSGQCSQGWFSCSACWPGFDEPYFVEDAATDTATWYQKTYNATIDTNFVCHTSSQPTNDNHQTH